MASIGTSGISLLRTPSISALQSILLFRYSTPASMHSMMFPLNSRISLKSTQASVAKYANLSFSGLSLENR